MIDATHIEAIRDSISASMPLLRQLAENSSPEPYTIENLGLTKFNIVISIFAFITSLAGAYYGWRGYLMSKMTAVNVERIKPYTQRRLIIQYFRSVLTSYLRSIIIDVKATDNFLPTIQYVNSLLLPPYDEFCYIDRFEQFKGCRIYRIEGEPIKPGPFSLSYKQRVQIEENASMKAVLQIKLVSIDVNRYNDLVKLMLSKLLNNDHSINFCFDAMIKKVNDVALRNLVVLSYIDNGVMSQCEYKLGREAVIDYLFVIEKEIEDVKFSEENVLYWLPIVECYFNNEKSLFYKLLNNKYFNVDKYVENSDECKNKGIKSKDDLNDHLKFLMSKLLVTQMKFY